MSFTQRKLIHADSDIIACSFVQFVGSYCRIINIPEELNIIQCYLTAIMRVSCSQLSLDSNLIVISFIARNLIIRNDVAFSISNDWMLANHFEPVTVQRADFSRRAPISLTRHWVLRRYRYIILLTCSQRIVFIADNDISFTFTVLLNHRSIIYSILFASFLRIEYVNSSIFVALVNNILCSISKMLLYRLIIRITLISTFYWRSILIDKTEVYFSLSFISSNCFQCLVDSTYLQLNRTKLSVITNWLLLEHLNLGWR